MRFLLRMTDIMTSRNIDLCSCDTPCKTKDLPLEQLDLIHIFQQCFRKKIKIYITNLPALGSGVIKSS
jgi:hypothetical protein